MRGWRRTRASRRRGPRAGAGPRGSAASARRGSAAEELVRREQRHAAPPTRGRRPCGCAGTGCAARTCRGRRPCRSRCPRRRAAPSRACARAPRARSSRRCRRSRRTRRARSSMPTLRGRPGQPEFGMCSTRTCACSAASASSRAGCRRSSRRRRRSARTRPARATGRAASGCSRRCRGPGCRPGRRRRPWELRHRSAAGCTARRGLVAPGDAERVQRRVDLVGRRRRRRGLDLARLDLRPPVAEARLHAPVVEAAVVEHRRLPLARRGTRTAAASPRAGPRSGPRSARSCRDARRAPARWRCRSAAPCARCARAVLRPSLLARARDRAGVAQQVDEARVRPAARDQVGDEDVVRRLVDEEPCRAR